MHQNCRQNSSRSWVSRHDLSTLSFPCGVLPFLPWCSPLVLCRRASSEAPSYQMRIPAGFFSTVLFFSYPQIPCTMRTQEEQNSSDDTDCDGNPGKQQDDVDQVPTPFQYGLSLIDLPRSRGQIRRAVGTHFCFPLPARDDQELWHTREQCREVGWHRRFHLFGITEHVRGGMGPPLRQDWKKTNHSDRADQRHVLFHTLGHVKDSRTSPHGAVSAGSW